tara:strand:+ start:8923 stop:9165 length:243 start_codon:yes stop_codon:yes gene_type:complete
MLQNTNIENFDEWMSWKDNAFDIARTSMGRRTPRKIGDSIAGICLGLGLRPGKDFQVTMYQVRFRTKTFLAMFKMNYKDE